jgi:predicted porin
MSTLAASPAAFAAATVYGHLDVGIQSFDNDSPTYNGSELLMGTNYGSGGSLLGFKASEDLGGGLKANAVAELGMSTDDGTLDNTANKLFQRQIYAGLEGGFGVINAGRQYTEGFLLQGVGTYNSTAGAIGTYFLNTNNPVRADNFIKYKSPSLGGVNIVAGYALGENTAATGPDDINNFLELGATYAGGPVRAGVVAQSTTQSGGGTVTSDLDTLVAAGQWSFGPATVYLTYTQTERDAAGTLTKIDLQTIAVGGKYTVGNGDIVLEVGQRKDDVATNADSTLAAIAYYHRLSKTTILYTAYGSVDNDPGASFNVPRQGAATVAGGSPSALFAGLRIIF